METAIARETAFEDPRSPDSSMKMDGPRALWLRRGLLVLFVGVATMISQYWVGNSTIYRPELEQKRELLHQYLLQNQLPPGVTWTSMGANSTNIRVGAVFLAEAMHRVFHISVLKAYVLLDTVALFCAMILLFVYLQRWFENIYCLVGVMFFAVVLPLTYMLFVFHPWDRLSLIVWLAALHLVRERRLWLLAVVLAIGMLIKYDVLLFPGLFFLAYVDRENWLRTGVITLLLFAVTFGMFKLVVLLRPGGFDSQLTTAQIVASNLAVLKEQRLGWPPFLGFSAPIVMAAIGFRSGNRFMQGSALFGMLLFIPFIFQSFMAEFRTEVPILLCLLPAALLGTKLILAPASTETLRPASPRS
jgi:hypothetical protein